MTSYAIFQADSFIDIVDAACALDAVKSADKRIGLCEGRIETVDQGNFRDGDFMAFKLTAEGQKMADDFHQNNQPRRGLHLVEYTENNFRTGK